MIGDVAWFDFSRGHGEAEGDGDLGGDGERPEQFQRGGGEARRRAEPVRSVRRVRRGFPHLGVC